MLMQDNGIDNQIDEAARRLTAGEPGGDLRARVLNRIDAGRTGWFGRSRWIWMAASALAVLVLALSVHGVHTVHEVQQVQGVQQVHEVPQVAEVQRAEHSVNRVNQLNPVNPVAEAESPFAPAPLEIAPLTLNEIPPAQTIVVEELTVSPIEVRAIDETAAPDALAQ